LRLLAQVKPSEILFKSISKEVTNVEVTYPSRFHIFFLFSLLLRFFVSRMLVILISFSFLLLLHFLAVCESLIVYSKVTHFTSHYY
jgi:hypothetical protein